jgi:hypothetical protein
MKKKTQAKKSAPAPVYEIKDLRMTKEEWAEVTEAAQREAAQQRIPYSRSNFCVRAVMTAVRKFQESTN